MDTTKVLARGHHRNNAPPATQKRDLRDLRMRLRDWGASPHNLSVLAPAILTSIALSFNTLVIT